MQNYGHVFRLSLKWRALIFTSLLLLALASLTAWFSNHALVQQFAQSQQEFYERQRNEVSLTLQNSAETMRQIASLIASSASIGDALVSGNSADIEAALKSQWPTLQLDAGIDDVSVYNIGTESLVALGQDTSVSRDAVGAAWLKSIVESEQPGRKLLCYEECRQYVAVPILVEGADAGVVMVSRSLADVTRYVQQSSGSEVALLVRSPGSIEDSPRILGSWNAKIIALTHEAVTLSLFRDISNNICFKKVTNQVGRYSTSDHTYEVIAIPIEKGEQGVSEASGYLLLVSDVTTQLASIFSTTNTVFLIALVGWLAAEFILFFMLGRRMDRLRSISQKLPLLAQRRYDVMRGAQLSRKSFFQDEVDVLENTAIDLEVQLESLEDEVAARGLQLEGRVKELARERDFVSGLFNTAQVLIVIHDRRRGITLTNRFCQHLLGLDEEALRGSAFKDIFTVDLVNIDEFFDNGGQQESKVVLEPGSVRTIVWYHTPIDDLGDDSFQELISVGVDITERKLAETRLAWLAHRDSLTELHNRRFFEDALSRAIVSGALGAVLYLDLDRFKEVNETSGHQSGDQLLRLVAVALASMGEGHVVARLGGDEFAILIENGSREVAVAMAKNIVDHLEQTTLHVEGRIHRASVSVGIALYPENGDAPDEIMANADYAMYKAKEDASQRWHVLAPNQQGREEIKQRIYWVETLRNALLNDEFELMVQPIFRLSNLEIEHYEVLLRLKGHDGKYISPGVFIPVAERSGQIAAIDRWVISNGIRMISTLSNEGVKLAINLSGQSLHDGDLTNFMRSEFERWSVSPSRLIFEVTETAAVTDFASARGVLESIRGLGCQIALDDFGVGFSSFYYLGHFPADYIKIDGSFIQQLPTSEENRLIVKAIADIARGMGKKTVAEFVDDAKILPFLNSYGVDYVQGYYLGRPISFRDLTL